MVKRIKGSIIVEASFVVPIVFLLIASLIFLGFNLYNGFAVKALMYKGMYAYSTEEMEEALETEISGRLIGADVKEFVAKEQVKPKEEINPCRVLRTAGVIKDIVEKVTDGNE